MRGLFISFRTEDALPQARSLSDQLRRKFGDDAISLDGRSVCGGESIPDKVRQHPRIPLSLFAGGMLCLIASLWLWSRRLPAPAPAN